MPGWADFPHVSSDATAPDQSPNATLLGPIWEEGRDGREEEGGAGELVGIGGVRVSRLHVGWQAMHQKMTALPFFLK